MRFAFPVAFVGLVLLGALAVAYLALERRRRRAARAFAAPETTPFVAPRPLSWRRHLPPLLLAAALAFLVVAAARPQAVMSRDVELATVMLVVDVSNSMNATDVAPSRLGAAHEAVRTFLEEIPPRFRVGAVAFADRAELIAPPTTDRDAVIGALEATDTSQGTLIGDGLARALKALEADWRREGESPGAVLLVSDGRDTGSRVPPDLAAARAAYAGVPVYSVAIGDVAAAPTTGPRPPDVELLRRIAADAGGGSFLAPTADELRQVYRDLGSRLTTEEAMQDVSVLFVAVAIGLALAAAAASLVWTRRML
jgi:Ca-activated chloride channel homolog